MYRMIKLVTLLLAKLSEEMFVLEPIGTVQRYTQRQNELKALSLSAHSNVLLRGYFREFGR